MNITEKILAMHCHREKVVPGDIVDIDIDVRLARDFGGANVIKNLNDNMLDVNDPSKTFLLSIAIQPGRIRAMLPTSTNVASMPGRTT